MAFIELSKIESKEIIPGYSARFIHTDNVSVAYWEIEAGAVMPEHSHPHEQIATVTEGTFSLTVDGEERLLTPGQVAVIASGISHGGRAITACRIMDVFHPVRDDYRK